METRQPPGPSGADERSDGAGLSAVGPPELPPFWLEWGRYGARKWPLPVFALAVAATALFLWAKPEGERVRPWEEYVRDAKVAFRRAIEAQDDRGEAARALSLLARENVQEVAVEQWKAREKAARAGGEGRKPVTVRKFDEVAEPSEGRAAVRRGRKWGFVDASGKVVIRPQYDEVVRFFEGVCAVRDEKGWRFIDGDGAGVRLRGFHGVLPSYDRVIQQAGEEVLRAEDFALIGESLYRLARIKREREAVGQFIHMSMEDLYRRAAEKLRRGEAAAAEAREAARARGRHKQARRLAAELESAKWRRRRRMWAECEVYLGEYEKAVGKLDKLIDEMNAAEAKRLREEKDPRAGSGGGGRDGGAAEAGNRPEEWARVYELLARSYDRQGNHTKAAGNYRLFLEQGVGGRLAHRARVRLAELSMNRAVAREQAAEARRGFEEVEALCLQVEKSDAPPELREDATFLRGRAAYRLGMMASAAPGAGAAFRRAAGAFGYPYSASGRYLDMSRVLLARALFLSGRATEALEIADGILRVGSQPAIYACAEVSRADMLTETQPAEAVGGRVESRPVTVKLTLGKGETPGDVLGLDVRELSSGRAAALGLERGGALAAEVPPGGPAGRAGLREGDVVVRFGKRRIVDAADLLEAVRKFRAGTEVGLGAVRPDAERGLTHGYMDAIRRIRRLTEADRARLVPELAELLEDGHFVELVPDPRRGPPAGRAQLLHLARGYSVLHQFDEAARIYLHILRAYPRAARDRYSFLLGELYAAKADRLDKLDRLDESDRRLKERRRARLAAARAFMQVPPKEGGSPLSAAAYWLAGRNYFAARRYDGASRALEEFTTLFGDDPRVSEGLYLLGESFRRMGAGERAAAAFARCSVIHRNDQFGYQSHLALGETYLEMGLLDAAPDRKGEDRKQNARAVFEAIRRDARYTPESQVWMKAFFRLGETYYRLGRRGLLRAREMKQKGEKSAVVSRALGEAQSHLRQAAEILEEAEERYPLAKYGPDRRSFRGFLKSQQLPYRRTLAMIRFHLREYAEAHKRFSEIIRETGAVSASDRADADTYRREAYTFKGLIELRQGQENPARYGAASRTFEKAYDDFARTSDGPWFRFAAAVALEKAGRHQEARTKYTEAIAAYRRLDPSILERGAAPVRKKGWILSMQDWLKHNQWVRGTL